MLIILMVGVILLGFRIMARIDTFIENGGFEERQAVQINKILMFGEQNIVHDISCNLMENNIPYCITKEPDVPENTAFHIVMALSDNDMDNLLLCNKAIHIYPHALTIAKCNDHIYKNVFDSVGIGHILSGPITSDTVLFAMKGWDL